MRLRICLLTEIKRFKSAIRISNQLPSNLTDTFLLFKQFLTSWMNKIYMFFTVVQQHGSCYICMFCILLTFEVIASIFSNLNIVTYLAVTAVGVWQVQIIRVDCSVIEIRLEIEPSSSLVSTLRGNNLQYGGSCKRNNTQIKALNCIVLGFYTQRNISIYYRTQSSIWPIAWISWCQYIIYLILC